MRLMTLLLLLPVVLSLAVLGAHFFRAGNALAVAAAGIVLLVIAIPRRWAARVVQVALVAGSVEWLRTLVRLARERADAGRPAGRLIAILGCVALVTALSALLFRAPALRRRYR
jgi:hypothetical protein